MTIVKHQSVNVESNALWSIYIFTYLRNIGPHFIHGVFLFSKVWVFVANFDGLFIFAYSSLVLWSWPLKRAWYHYISSFSNLYLKGCQLCLTFCFLRKGWIQPYYVFLDCPPAWSCPPSVQFGFSLAMRLCGRRFGYLKGIVFKQKFWNSKLFQTQKSFWHRFKANSLWRNSSDSYW